MIVACLRRLQEHEPQLRVLSLDKGFWSTAVYEELSRTLTLVAVPKKGKRTVDEQARGQASDRTGGVCLLRYFGGNVGPLRPRAVGQSAVK